MVDFTDGPAPRGYFAPLRFEADIFDCEVEGRIPRELNGAFVRVGGEYFYPPSRADDSPFSTDGFISRFRIADGNVDFKARWIRTPRFLNNLAARRQLYGVYRNPFTADPSNQYADKPFLGTVMNTAPIAHHGKLYALKEDAHPYEIDPNTLETLGPWNFGGKYKAQTFSAHPKVDPVSGEMICYGYEATGLCSDDLWIYSISPQGEVVREYKVKVPYVSCLHDMVLTQKYMIFPVYGYVTSLERLRAGHLHWAWDKSMPTYWGFVPRAGDGSDVRWFKGPASVVMHTINAFDEGDKVIVDAPISDGNPFPFFPQIDGAPWSPPLARHTLRRLEFNLASAGDGYVERILDPTDVVDLARIDDRYLSLPYRYVYSSMSDPSQPFDTARAGPNRVVNSYFRYDLSTGEWRKFFAGDVHNLQEVTFIPRSASAAEGDGWLIGTASNYAELRTELVIVDASEMQELARVILPFRMTPQVHARWYGNTELPFSSERLPPWRGRVQEA
jgi:carotenoid cleavage dioxygenase-like enzyme